MWKLSWASAQGLTYFNEGRNNQDAVDGWTDSNMVAGIINDGCSGLLKQKLQSEIGAQLSNGFLMRKSVAYMLGGTRPSLIPSIIFPAYIDYLNQLVESQNTYTYEQKVNFILKYLLCTTFGLIADQKETCVFWAGDGVIYLNNGVYREVLSPLTGPDLRSTPKYPAYHLLHEYGYLDEELQFLIPDGFQTIVFQTDSVETIGIASDGLHGKPSLMDELKAHSESQMSLQFCLNRIAAIRAETTDNVSVVFANKVKGV